jgi:hypothetical protein
MAAAYWFTICWRHTGSKYTGGILVQNGFTKPCCWAPIGVKSKGDASKRRATFSTRTGAAKCSPTSTLLLTVSIPAKVAVTAVAVDGTGKLAGASQYAQAILVCSPFGSALTYL